MSAIDRFFWKAGDVHTDYRHAREWVLNNADMLREIEADIVEDVKPEDIVGWYSLNGKRFPITKRDIQKAHRAIAEPELSEAERMALKNYTGPAFAKFNKEAREYGDTIAVKMMDNILDRSQTTAPIVVFRGEHDDLSTLKSGKGFLSTTTDFEQAEKYAGENGRLYELHVPKGYSAISLLPYSLNEEESEILLPRGNKVKTVGFRKIGDKTVEVVELSGNEFAEDEAHWITIHPNGPREKGQPILVDGEKWNYTVLGGMGGQFNGQKMQDVVKGGEKKAVAQGKKPLSEMTVEDLPENIQKAIEADSKNLFITPEEYLKSVAGQSIGTIKGQVEYWSKHQDEGEYAKNKADIYKYILEQKTGESAQPSTEEPKEEAAGEKKPFDELTLKDLPEDIQDAVDKLAKKTHTTPEQYWTEAQSMAPDMVEQKLKDFAEPKDENQQAMKDVALFVQQNKFGGEGAKAEEPAAEQPTAATKEEPSAEPKAPSQLSFAELPTDIQDAMQKMAKGTGETPEGLWDEIKGFPADEIQKELGIVKNQASHEGLSESTMAEVKAEKAVWSFLAGKKEQVEQAEQKPLSAIKYEDLPQDIKNEVESWAKIFAKQGKTPEGVWESWKNQGEESIEKEKKLLEGQKESLSELGLSHLKVLEFMSQYQNGAKKEVSEKSLAEMTVADLPKDVQDAVNVLAEKHKKNPEDYWASYKDFSEEDIKYLVDLDQGTSNLAAANKTILQYMLDKKQGKQPKAATSPAFEEPANPFAPSASSANSGTELKAYQKQKYADFVKKYLPEIQGATVEVKDDGIIYVNGVTSGYTAEGWYKNTAFTSAKEVKEMLNYQKKLEHPTKEDQLITSFLEKLYQERKQQAWAKAPTKLSPSLEKLKAQPSVESIVGDIAKTMPGVSINGDSVYVDGHYLDRHDLVMKNAYQTSEDLADQIKGIEKRLAAGEKNKELEFHLAFKKAVLAAKQGNPQVTSAELTKEHPAYDSSEATADAMHGYAVHEMLGRPKTDKAKVKDYTSHYDRYMNGLLRSKNGYLAPSDTVDRIHAFDKLMAESRLQEPVVLYRGLEHAKMEAAGLNPKKMFAMGGEYPDDGFESTSTSVHEAKKFGGGGGPYGTVLKLLVPSGVGAVSALKDSHYSYEKEVILDRGLRWRTVGETVEDGVPVKIMELVGNTGDNNA